MNSVKESLPLHFGASKHRPRSKNDFYPTPPEVTVALLDHLNLPTSISIWEPAFGEMDMANVISSRGHEVLATDLNMGVDFLKTVGEHNFIITNPPFTIAEDFIRKAASESILCAMLLKSNYFHAKKRIQLFKDFPPNQVLPLTWRPDFLFKERKEGERGSSIMDMSWYVWEKGNLGPCIYKPLVKPIIK